MRIYAGTIGAVLLGAAALLGQTAQAQQPMGTIRVNQPANASTVNAPVTLQVAISGVTVKPAAEGDPNAFHYHALVDVDPVTVVQAGQPIPTGQANIIHTHEPSLMLPDLAPGQHTVTVILTRTDHVPLMPNVQDRVTFTVAAPGAAQPAMPAAQPTAAAAQPSPAPAGAAPSGAAQPGAATSPRAGHGGAVLVDNRASTAMAATLAGVVVVTIAGAAVYARRRVRN
jgi:hypothetical protein